jgi:hypothetical protein
VTRGRLGGHPSTPGPPFAAPSGRYRRCGARLFLLAATLLSVADRAALRE